LISALGLHFKSSTDFKVRLRFEMQTRFDWHEVPGLAFARQRRTAYSAIRRPEPDPDRLPFLQRADGAGCADDTAAILGSRGCYNHCSFCPIPAFYRRGGGWRGKSPDISPPRWPACRNWIYRVACNRALNAQKKKREQIMADPHRRRPPATHV
jgi:hypothetical protein